jgi:hypothetical protein
MITLAGALVVSQHTSCLRIDDRTGTWVLRQLAVIRTPWLTDVANGINVAPAAPAYPHSAGPEYLTPGRRHSTRSSDGSGCSPRYSTQARFTHG